VAFDTILTPERNLESVLNYEGTSEVHARIMGQALIGLAASK
jgi:hypothetical protein